MRAMVQTNFGGHEALSLRSVRDPVPGPLEVVVRVVACGVNRLDVQQRRGPAVIPGFRLPHIAGMDVAGSVAAVGLGVTAVCVGDKVVVDPAVGCGTCGHCRAGAAGNCPGLRVVGGNMAGGFAEYVTVPAGQAHRLPGEVDLNDVAVLPTAWSTAWRAAYGVGRVQQSDWVVVQAAASSVSIAVIQLAKRVGASVIAVASSDEKLAIAGELGADVLVHNDDDVLAAVRECTDGHGADLVLDHVGTATWTSSVACLALGGRLVVLGNTSGDQAVFSLMDIYHRGLALLGAGAYTAADFAAVVDAFCAGGLRTPRAAVYDLAELPAALARQESRDNIGKVLVKP
jgi:NADPH:quinone reductase-like Zn-dependent oxidoreductase